MGRSNRVTGQKPPPPPRPPPPPPPALSVCVSRFALLLPHTRHAALRSLVETIKKKTGRPARLSPPLVGGGLCRPTSSSSGPPSTRPAAFGLGGGNNKKPASNSDAMASAAAEAEAAAAKVGQPVSDAAAALSAEVAAEAAEAGAAAAAEVGASSALSPAPAAASLPPAPVRSAGPGKGSQARGSAEEAGLSVQQFARQLQQQQQQQRRPTTLAGRRARGFARVLLYAGVAYALLSLGAAVMRVARRANSPRQQRLRTVDRNKRVVETLNAVFLNASASPDSSASSSSSAAVTSLTPALMRKLRSETGFSAPEVFRKYLWYLLRERRFDSTAVADLVALRNALELSDADVASAIKERAQRIYDKVRSWRERERERRVGDGEIVIFFSTPRPRPLLIEQKISKL